MAETASAGAVERVKKGILSNAGVLIPNNLVIEPEKK
jgi:hypothetical protein